MRNKLPLIVVIVLIIGAVVVLSNPFGQQGLPSPLTSRPDSTQIGKSSEVGQQAADFELEDFQGQKVKLADFKGKVVFIDFWAAWCPFCVEEMPEIEKVHQQLGDQLVILGIHRSETESVAKGAEFARKRGVTYTLLKDSTGQVYKTLTGGRNFMPYAVYLDKNGVIQKIKAGPKTAEEIRSNIEELIK